MSLVIELSPEVEERLRTEAERQGVAPEAYASDLLTRSLPRAAEKQESWWGTLSHEEWVRRTREFAESNRDWPVLPREALERASFYDDGE